MTPNSNNIGPTPHSPCNVMNDLFNPFFNSISKCSTITSSHHPRLYSAQFFILETRKISSAYAKTTQGLKMGNSKQLLKE